MRIAVALLLLIGFGALTNALADGVLRLDLDRTVKYGCTVDEQTPYFRATVWADYQGSPLIDEDGKRLANAHDYSEVYAMRDSRRKALNDCDKWIDRTAKEIAVKQKAGRK